MEWGDAGFTAKFVKVTHARYRLSGTMRTIHYRNKLPRLLILFTVTLASFTLLHYVKNYLLGPDSVKIEYVDTSESIIIKRIQETNPNFPVAISQGNDVEYSEVCARYVNPLDIKHNNVYWQVQKTSEELFYLYGAYYDDRPTVGPAVRILGIREKRGLNISQNLHCQMWFSSGKNPVIVNVDYIQYLWREEWGYEKEEQKPYLLSCMVPQEYQGKVPDSVSLVEKPCENATNNLPVIDNRPPKGEKEDFFVCVKCLNFKHRPDVAVRLVEWIELLRILGAQKIVFYSLQINDEIAKVLKHYEDTWNVEVISTTLPGTLPNIPDYMFTYLSKNVIQQCFQDLIDYNDCFYKNFNLYKYAVMMDIDEVIMPRGSIRTWKEMLQQVTIPDGKLANEVQTYAARNVYFMDDKSIYHDWVPGIPKYMHMLQNVRRHSFHSPVGIRTKSFHATEHNLAVHNHYGRTCISREQREPSNWCFVVEIDLDVGYMQHYCVKRKLDECKVNRKENTTEDNIIWKYKSELISATQQNLKQVDIL